MISHRAIFGITTILLGIFYFINFVISKRIPLGHDTFQYLQLQYSFLNELIMKGEIPQWFPFLTKGTVTNIWFLIQNGILNNFYYPLVKFFHPENYYFMFYASVFFDEIVLITGTILLSKEFYKNTWTVLFVTTTVFGTAIWASQIWWSFHLYYMMPLVLYLYIKAIKEKSISNFLMGNVLLIIWSFYGNLPYQLPVITLFVALTVIIYWLLYTPPIESLSIKSGKTEDNRRYMELKIQFTQFKTEIFAKKLKDKRVYLNILKIISVTVLTLTPIFIIYKYLTSCGAGEIVYRNFMREAGGKVAYGVFLNYSKISYLNYKELVTGVPADFPFLTLSLDQFLYVGILPLTFFILAIYMLIKKILQDKITLTFLIVLLLLVSFSVGGFFAKLSYFFWPLMDRFRHVGLVSCIAKLYIIFIAGFAFDKTISLAKNDETSRYESLTKFLFFTTCLILLGKLISVLVPFKHRSLIYEEASSEIMIFKLTSIVITTIFLLIIWKAKNKKLIQKNGIKLLILIIILNSWELLTYRSLFFHILLPPTQEKNLYELFKFTDYPFQPDRSMNYDKNARFQTFIRSADIKYKEILKKGYCIFQKWGAYYWNSDQFFYFDPCSSIFRVDHRLINIDRYYIAYNEKFLPLNIEQPIPSHPAFLKIMGCNSPKIQFFENIYSSPKVEYLIADTKYQGDILLTDTETKNVQNPINQLDDNISSTLLKNERLDIPYKVVKFSANHIEMEISNNYQRPIIMHYADAFHKYWKAYVNGRETTIYCTNLGFKGIVVPPGNSTIDFIFREKKVFYAHLFLITFGNLGVILILYNLVSLLKAKKTENDKKFWIPS
ncbi:MAG: hypothetical protein N2317_01575 [Syntrophales bacterium]|nr:hypothetical protein [Syntrophales bacterium]